MTNSNLPWKFDVDSYGDEIYFGGHDKGLSELSGSDGVIIGYVGGHGVPETEANAAYIVQAANAFPAMLAALEAVEWRSTDGMHRQCCPSCRSYRKMEREHEPDCKLAAAIKAAKGESA